MPAWTCKPHADLTTAELYALLTLRSVVFVMEQNCPTWTWTARTCKARRST